MNTDKLSPTELKQYLNDYWDVPKSDLPMVELTYFGEGKEFLVHGVMRLHTVFRLLSHGLLSVTDISVDPYWDEFDVIALKPNFKALCEAYIPPEGLSNLGTFCEYEQPNEAGLYDETISEEEYSKDYRGAGVFMFSEGRLRSEIKTSAREWIEYRTPYRLET